MEVIEESVVANGQDGELEPLEALEQGQERLLFFAAVLVGHRVEVQVRSRGLKPGKGGGGSGDHWVLCFCFRVCLVCPRSCSV